MVSVNNNVILINNYIRRWFYYNVKFKLFYKTAFKRITYSTIIKITF